MSAGEVMRVSVDAALVTVQAVKMDGKRLSIAAYNQIPAGDWSYGDKLLYWINRCPASCHGHEYETRHVLADRGGAPVVLSFADTRNVWEWEQDGARRSGDHWAKELANAREAFARATYYATTTRNPPRRNRWEPRDWEARARSLEGDIYAAYRNLARARRRFREMGVASLDARSLWATVLAVPQGYIAI